MMVLLLIVSFIPLLFLLSQRFLQALSRMRKTGFVPWCPEQYLPRHITRIDGRNPHHTLYTWAKTYGDICRFKVLGESIVVLNSAELVQQANQGNAIAGRPRIFRIDYGFHYGDDVIFGNFSPRWLNMKKLMVQNLREFGTGAEKTEQIVSEEITCLLEEFGNANGNAFDPSLILITAVVNALSASIMGKRFSATSPEMTSYQRTTRLFSEACSPVTGIELDLFPWLRFLPNKNFKKLSMARDLLDSWVDKELMEIRNNFKGEGPTCILEAFIKAKLDCEDDDGQKNPEDKITDQDVRCLFIDLLVSGTFTTSIALNVFCLLMAVDGDLQNNIRSQIEEVVKEKRAPNGQDRERLPLLEATVMELLRYISHVPLSLPHYTLQDVQLGGYKIPKNTQVLYNLWHIHHDEKLWEEPWRFNPHRFLQDNQLIPPNHPNRRNLMPFSGGRRACPGDNLAKERIMVFAAAILQHFRLECDPEYPDPSHDPRQFQLGLILEPKPFKIKAIPL